MATDLAADGPDRVFEVPVRTTVGDTPGKTATVPQEFGPMGWGSGLVGWIWGKL